MPYTKTYSSRKIWYQRFLLFLISFFMVYIFEFALAIFKSKATEKRQSFNTQFAHPYYYFGLPTDADKLKELNTDFCSVDERGFRGEGPKFRGNRKLAFFTGGSVAFGAGVDNRNTIAANLNRLQTEYFFVTAAAPSWNSYQELLLYIKGLRPEKPSLVLALNGANDYYVGAFNWATGLGLPLDTPESFFEFDRWVEDIRSLQTKPMGLFQFLWRHPVYRHLVLFNLRTSILREGDGAPEFDISEEWAFERSPLERLPSDITSKYFENIGMAAQLAKMDGTRYLSFFQPHRYLHMKNFDSKEKDEIFHFQNYKKYAQKVVTTKPDNLVDLSRAFGSIDDQSIDKIFSDEMHLTNLGNELLARAIASELVKRKIVSTIKVNSEIRK